MNPFSSVPYINYQSPHPNGGFFWEFTPSYGNEYVWTDIAFVKMSSAVNRIITVFTVPRIGSYNIFTAWSDDYGATVAGNQILYDYTKNYGHHMVFNGTGGNKAGIIVYNRLAAGSDFDIYCKYTTDGGITWISNYIDGSINMSISSDVKAPRSSTPMFRIAYVSENYQGRWGYYTGGYPGNWNLPVSQIMTPGNLEQDARITAGYKSDDCFMVYTGPVINSLFSSNQCIMNNKPISFNVESPLEFRLLQNYPNPFNPSTSIKFTLPQSSKVSLIVYDELGSKVTELVNNRLEAGSYDFSFDGTGLASGVYFYRLTAGQNNIVKKMLLIK